MLSDEILRKRKEAALKKEKQKLIDLEHVKKNIIIAKLFIKGIPVNKVLVKPSNSQMYSYLSWLRSKNMLDSKTVINATSVGVVHRFLKDHKINLYKEGVSNAQMRAEIDKLNQIIQNG